MGRHSLEVLGALEVTETGTEVMVMEETEVMGRIGGCRWGSALADR